MIGFALTDEQQALRETARRFAQKEMIPVAAHHDQTMEYPWDVIKKAHATGLLNLSLPASVGGLEVPLLDQMIINEELACGCSGIYTAMAANDLALTPLVLAGTPEQIKEFAGPMADEPKMASYCVTEPGAGSDVAGIRTTVRRTGDDFVMNGEKMWITNASKASWFYVLATLDPAQGHKAMCAFAIPADLEGIKIGKKEVNLGQRCSDTRGIVFRDVRIPKRYLLGKEGDGFKIAMRAFDKSRPGTAIGGVGVARAAFEHATRYALQRQTFGKPIAKHQAVAFMIADMAKDIEAARYLCWRAAWDYDNGVSNTAHAAMAKCFGGDVAVRVTQDAVQVFGGYGYNTEFPVEKLYRDAKIFQIYEGTNQVQRLIIARELFDAAGE